MVRLVFADPPNVGPRLKRLPGKGARRWKGKEHQDWGPAPEVVRADRCRIVRYAGSSPQVGCSLGRLDRRQRSARAFPAGVAI